MMGARGKVRKPAHRVAFLSINSRNFRAPISSLQISKDLNLLRHELRTPLTGMLGLAELLSGIDLPGQATYWLATLQACGQQMASLIDRTLRTEPQTIEAETQASTDGLALLETLMLAHWPAAREAGIRLLLVFEREALGLWQLDEVALRQALDNLLSNAIRVTQAGYVSLEARVIPQNGVDHDLLELVIEDCGPGFTGNPSNLQDASEYADRSYRMFSRGRGLKVVEQVCQRYSGQLQQSPSSAGGARFTLSLPGVGASRQARRPPFRPTILEKLHCLLLLEQPQKRAIAAMLACLDIAFESIASLEDFTLNTGSSSQVLICARDLLPECLRQHHDSPVNPICLLSLKQGPEGDVYELQALQQPLLQSALQTALLRCLVRQGMAVCPAQEFQE